MDTQTRDYIMLLLPVLFEHFSRFSISSACTSVFFTVTGVPLSHAYMFPLINGSATVSICTAYFDIQGCIMFTQCIYASYD